MLLVHDENKTQIVGNLLIKQDDFADDEIPNEETWEAIIESEQILTERRRRHELAAS